MKFYNTFSKYILIIILSCVSISINGQTFYYSKNINNLWGKWDNNISYTLGGTYSHFYIYSTNDHPSNYKILVSIPLFDPNNISKKIKKETVKKKKWYEFKGSVEYYTKGSDKFIDRFPYGPGATDPDVDKHVSEAIIKIQPFKKNPQVYNIYFDGIGLAIWIP